MENNNKNMRWVRAAGDAVVAVAIFIAIITIGGELFAPLKNWLKAAFTHHWLGKSALSIILFVLIFILRSFTPASPEQVRRAILSAAWWSVLSAVAMTLFFILHTFKVI